MEAKEFVTFFGILATFAVGFINLIFNSSHNKKLRYIETITTERIKWINIVRSLLSEYMSMVNMYDYKKILESKERDEFLRDLEVLSNKIILSLNPTKDVDIIQKIKELNKMIYYVYFLADWTKIKDEKEKIESFLRYTDMDFFKYFMKEHNIDPKSLKSYDDMVIKLSKYLNEEILKESMDRYNYDLNLRKQFREKNKELSDISQKMLKKEWDRVKLESEHGDTYSWKD